MDKLIYSIKRELMVSWARREERDSGVKLGAWSVDRKHMNLGAVEGRDYTIAVVRCPSINVVASSYE